MMALAACLRPGTKDFWTAASAHSACDASTKHSWITSLWILYTGAVQLRVQALAATRFVVWRPTVCSLHDHGTILDACLQACSTIQPFGLVSKHLNAHAAIMSA